MNIQFGTGVLYGNPTAGNLAANPTPQKFGILQEFSLEFKGDLKQLWGQKQFSEAKARGKITVSGKGKFATWDPRLFNQLYFGQTETPGITIMATDEPVTVASSVVVANHLKFVSDWGVIDAATGTQLTKVAGSPGLTSLEYSVDESTGTYTFAAGDAGNTVYISYTYTDSARGITVALNNQFMGYAPEFKAFLFNTFRNKIFGVDLVSCSMETISVPTKQEDFWMSDLGLTASVDAAGLLGHLYADRA